MTLSSKLRLDSSQARGHLRRAGVIDENGRLSNSRLYTLLSKFCMVLEFRNRDGRGAIVGTCRSPQ